MIKRKLPTFFEIYKQLIQTPSVSSINKNIDQSNENLINLLASWFEELGFYIQINEIPNSNKKFNLLATSNQNSTGGLLLVGHTDTVPYFYNQWKYDPFILKEHDNKFYGLGSVDMKGFFAFIIDILRYVDITKFKKPLHILATADEETTMIGIKYFIKSTKLKPNYALIGEPTSLVPIYSHKGYMAYSFIANGSSGHSSDIKEKINSINIIYKVIKNLFLFKKKLKIKYHNENFTIPYCTLNFGFIKGGEAPNIICSNCELQIDIRTLPNISLNYINNLLNSTFLNKKYYNNLIIKKLHPPIPSFECMKNHNFVKTIEKISDKKSDTVNYVTEASFIQKICPTIVFGPGCIKQAHQPNEFMDTSFINPTLNIMKKIIKYFCY